MDSINLKKAGLKPTHPRKTILELLQESEDHHLSAEDVYRQLLERNESIGIATVYRVLAQFESAGLVTRHHFEGITSVFELNRGQHHDHLICLKCGAIIEFTDEKIERQQEKVAAQAGFKIRDHALYIFAECNNPAQCERNKNSDS